MAAVIHMRCMLLRGSWRSREGGNRRRKLKRTTGGDPERGQRVRAYWEPYHAAIDRMIAAAPAEVLLSIHSFTPVYEGEVREVEIGVLFCTDAALAEHVAEGLRARTGREVRLNEPYSGVNGLMYACYRHAQENGLLALELEFRQDLLADPEIREALRAATAEAVREAISRCVR